MAKLKKKAAPAKSDYVPPVGGGGIQKKDHTASRSTAAPTFIVPPMLNFPPAKTNPSALPGFPILPFPARIAGPSTSSAGGFPDPSGHYRPPIIPPFNPISARYGPTSMPFVGVPPGPFPPPHGFMPSHPFPFPAPHHFRPHHPHPHLPPPSLVHNPTLATKKRSPAKNDQSEPSRPITEKLAKNTQLKFAKQIAARANKRKSLAPIAEVKAEPGAPGFNLFMNIAQRYRTTHKLPDAIQIRDDNEEEEEAEQPGEEAASDAAESNDMTIMDNMSICTVDEVGENTMGDDEREGEESARRAGGESEDEDIVCLGEQKGTRAPVVMLGDDTEEEEEDGDIVEVDVLNRRIQSVIDLDMDEEEEEAASASVKKVASAGAVLPDFIPLIDAKKKNGTTKPCAPSRSQHGQQLQQQQREQGASSSEALLDGSSLSSSPVVVLKRTKSRSALRAEKKRKNYRKIAETRAQELGASSSAVAIAASSSALHSQTITPSRIPLPTAAAPLTPLAHLYRFPPGSSIPFPSTSSSAMGLIQSRGLTTSTHQSQPLSLHPYGMSSTANPTPSTSSAAAAGTGDPPAATLAAVLNDERAGVVRDSLSASGLFRRQWEERWMMLSSDPEVKVDPSAAPFRICSYNVLCQKTIGATSYLYSHANFQRYVLEWAHRWPLIQRELSELNADVFGLQEIQDVHFEQFYEPFMKSLGYTCFFQRKSETMHSDGLGIFVKSSRFKICSMKIVDFRVPGDQLLDRGNIAQLLRLECLQTGAPLIVSNTHILFNEKRGDVKLGQIALLMANIHAIRQAGEPVICLGDWNLEPASDLYEYITRGSLDATRFIARYGSGQLREGRNSNFGPMRELPRDTHLKTRMSRDGILHQNEDSLLQSLRSTHPSILSHQISLTSAYAPYRERQVSTYHKDVANPDFIFYSNAGRGETGESARLRLIRRLSVPSESSIRATLEPWPNHSVPSDHIPLLAEFYLAK